MKEEIIAHLHKYIFLSQTAAKEFSNILSLMEIDKGEVFIKEAKSNDKEYFLLDGPI